MVLLWLASKNWHFMLLPDQQVLIDLGANYGLLTCTGQYWRVITALFLHLGILHFLINMYALTKVGPVAEELFGWKEFLLIYFFSGIMGSLASLMWDPLLVGVGASGAVFGVYGSLLSFMYVQRDEFPPEMLRYHALMAVGLLICNALYGMMMPEIDNFAHLGGVLAGAFAGFLLAHVEIARRYRTTFSVPVMALLIWALASLVFARFEERGYLSYKRGIEALKNHQYQAAVDLFTTFIRCNPQQPGAYGSRGLAYNKLGLLEHALTDFGRAIDLAPDRAEPYNSKAWVEAGLKMYEAAVQDASISLKRNPRSAATYDTRGYAYAKLGRVDDALADFDKAALLDREDTASRYHRMRLYEQLGRLPEANADRSLAKRYQPESWEF